MASASINSLKSKHRRDFGLMLRQARERAGMDQSEVAERLAVAQTSISNWESGKTSPADRNLQALIALGLVSDLSTPEVNAIRRSEKSSTLTVRLTDTVRDELERASKSGPYPTSLTAIVERGIILAVAELDEMAAHARKPSTGGRIG